MPGATEALGYCAAGVAFFIAVAIALEFNREWITVAYAVEFAAVAAIASRLGLNAMRRLCWPLLAVVVVRFVLNPEVLKYPLGRHADLQLDPVGLRPVDRGLRRRPALPAADRRRAAGARDRGSDRPAGLRAADPRGAQRLPPRRHDGARRALHGARVLCPGVGRLRARRAVAGAHAARRRGAVGLAHQRRARRGAGAGRPGPARQPDLRQGRCRPPADRQRPVPGLRPAGGDGGAGAALDRRRAEPQRGAVRRGGRLDPGLRLRVARGPPSVRSGLRAAGAGGRPAWSSTSTPRSGCCSASPCWRWASCATRRRCAMPAWRWSASWSPRSS